MKIVIPDDYQDMIHLLPSYALIRHHDVVRYRTPARDFDQLVERLRDADVVVAIRERVNFSRALLSRLLGLKLLALVGRNASTIDFVACTELGIPVSVGKSNSPVAPAELTIALIVASRRNIALEAERMRRGEWPCTLSHRLRGSTLGIFGLGAIGNLVAQAGCGLGMNVLVFGREGSRVRAAAAGYEVAADKAEFFARSNILSLHVRLTADTRGIVGPEDLARMKPTALIGARGTHRAGRPRGGLAGRPARLRRCRRLRGRAGHRRQSPLVENAQRAVRAASRLGRMGQFRSLFRRGLRADRRLRERREAAACEPGRESVALTSSPCQRAIAVP